MDGKQKEELTEEASRLFENVHLRNIVLELPQIEKKHEETKKQEEVSRIEEIKAKLRKGASFSREAVPQHVEQELKSLHQEEVDLTNAKPILQSKLFRFAPFLMNLTKSGREKLSVIKRLGLDTKAVGSGNKNIELARAFRLKAVREKEASMQGQVEQRFADNLDRREWSKDREFYDRLHPFTQSSAESIRDKQRLERGDTRLKNVSSMRRSLEAQGGSESLFNTIISSFFGRGKTTEAVSGPTFGDIITPNQITKDTEDRFVGETVEQNVLPEEDEVPETVQSQEVVTLPKEEVAMYTEALKNKKEGKTKATEKPKRKSHKKRLL